MVNNQHKPDDDTDFFDLLYNDDLFSEEEKKKIVHIFSTYSKGDKNNFVFQLGFILKTILKTVLGFPGMIQSATDDWITKSKTVAEQLNKPNIGEIQNNLINIKRDSEDIIKNMNLEKARLTSEINDLKNNINEKKELIKLFQSQNDEEKKTYFKSSVILFGSIAGSMIIIILSIVISIWTSSGWRNNDITGDIEFIRKKNGDVYVKLTSPLKIYKINKKSVYGKVIDGKEKLTRTCSPGIERSRF